MIMIIMTSTFGPWRDTSLSRSDTAMWSVFFSAGPSLQSMYAAPTDAPTRAVSKSVNVHVQLEGTTGGTGESK